MSDVFISYSRKDIAFARLLYQHFCTNQLDAWIDWERIPIGQDWWKEICTAIENADVFMFVISKHSVGSSVCKDEINQALSNNKRLVPVLLDDISPAAVREFVPELSQKNWFILQVGESFHLQANPAPSSDKPEDQWIALPKQPQFEEALKKLNQDIHTDWEWVKEHTRLQVRALEWERSDRKAGYLIRGEALTTAETWLDLAAGKNPQPTVLQAQFISTSRQAETQRQQEELKAQQENLRLEQEANRAQRAANRRQRIILWVVAAGLGVALVLGGLFLSQRNQYLAETHVRATAESNAVSESNNRATAEANAIKQADQRATAQAIAEEQRNLAQAGEISALAQGRIDDRFDLALLLSGAAYRKQDNYETRSGLLSAVSANPGFEYFLYGHSDSIYSLAYSPDGARVASASQDGTVILWDTGTRKIVGSPLKISSLAALSVAFSPDSRILATGSCGKPDPSGLCLDGEIYLWDAATSEKLGKMNGVHAQGVVRLAFSRDGRILASGDTSGEIRLWDVAGLEPIGKTMLAENGVIMDLSFNSDGSRLLSAVRVTEFTQDPVFPIVYHGMLRVWDVPNQAETEQYQNCPEAFFMSVVYNSIDEPIGACDLHSGITLWNLTKSESQSMNIFAGFISSLAFSGDGVTLVSGGCARYQSNGATCIQGEVHLWNVWNGTLARQPLWGDADFVNNLALTPDGRHLAANSARIGAENKILIWDLVDTDSLTSPIPDVSQAGAAASSPDGRLLAVASKNSILLYNETPQSPFTATLAGHTGAVTSLAFSPDSRLLASGGDDQAVYVWDPAAGKALFGPLAAHQKPIASLAFTPDGKQLVSVSTDGELIRWEAASGQELSRPLAALDEIPNILALSPDGQTLAAAFCKAEGVKWSSGVNCLNGEIRLWDTQSGQPRGEPLQGHPYQVNNLAFSPDNRLLASTGCSHVGSAQTCDRGEIRVWDLSTGKELIQPLVEHTENVIGLAFSPDGKEMASVSMEDRLIVWDAVAWHSIGQISGSGGLNINATNVPLLFSPDNQKVFTIQNELRQFTVDPQAWLKMACRMANRDITNQEWQTYLSGQPYQAVCSIND